RRARTAQDRGGRADRGHDARGTRGAGCADVRDLGAGAHRHPHDGRNAARHPGGWRRTGRGTARRDLPLARRAAVGARRRAGGCMSLELDAEEFERIVIDELDELPDDMVDGLENVVFVCEDRPEDGSLDLLGIYEGVALTERGQYGFGELPDRIVLFREPLLAICETEDELRDEIHITLVHEIAHYYGIDDEELHRLGWA